MWPFDRDPERRIQKLRARRDVKSLIQVFQATDSEYIAASAARALGEIGDPSAAQVLLDAVGRTIIRGDHIWGMDVLRKLVTEALIKMGEPVIPYVVSAMEKYVATEEWLGARVTDEVLMSLGVPGAEALTALTKHADRRVRASAVLVLGRLLDQVICGVLYLILADRFPDVARPVAELGSAGIMAVRPICKPLGISVDGSVAAQAMGERTYKAAIEALDAALEDKDSWVREKAQEALRQIHWGE